MMKSRGNFTYPSKICKENGVEWKGYCKDMMNLFDNGTNKNITPTYCRKQSVSLNATRVEYIPAKKKASKDSSSNEEYDPKELYQWIWIL